MNQELLNDCKVHIQIDNAFDSIVDCKLSLLYMFLSLIYKGCLSGFFECLFWTFKLKFELSALLT